MNIMEFYDAFGNKVKANIILFFEFKINKKNYLVYTLSHDELIFDSDKNKVYIEEAKKIDGKNYLHKITDAREWNLLKEYFYKFTAKLI